MHEAPGFGYSPRVDGARSISQRPKLLLCLLGSVALLECDA